MEVVWLRREPLCILAPHGTFPYGRILAPFFRRNSGVGGGQVRNFLKVVRVVYPSSQFPFHLGSSGFVVQLGVILINVNYFNFGNCTLTSNLVVFCGVIN